MAMSVWVVVLWTAVALGVLLAVGAAVQFVGSRHWAGLVHADLGRLETLGGQGVDQAPPAPCYDARELQGLPAPVARYFRTVLKDGQPIIAAVFIDLAGTLNLSAEGEQWKPFTARQRVVTSRPGFLWDARVQMAPLVATHVKDSYIDGQGRLLARLLGLFTVARLEGGGEIARGELMRWFAEAVWYPTALLPSQGVKWAALDGTAATATITDGSLKLSLLFRFDAAGLIASVHAEARGAGSGQGTIMLPWDCVVSAYRWHQGMLLPTHAEAAYQRPGGRKAYFVATVQALSLAFR
jgi:hypothetical protein